MIAVWQVAISSKMWCSSKSFVYTECLPMEQDSDFELPLLMVNLCFVAAVPYWGVVWWLQWWCMWCRR